MSTRVAASDKIHLRASSGATTGQGFSGNAAALKAGRRLADPAAVDQAVRREIRRFEAARDRMRSALIPYIQAAS